jgi:putative ABC transport system permease protein
MNVEFRAKRLLKIGAKSLWRHKLRSSLTVLGITFGVCSVVAMLAIGQGAGYEAQQQIAALGSHNIIIQSVEPPTDESEDDFVVEYGLRYVDAERIRANVPGVSVLTQARKMREVIRHGRHSLETNIVGTMPWYPEVSKLTVRQGRFFNSQDMYGRKNICVLGRKAANVLFPFGGAIGQLVNVRELRYRVVGILGGAGRGEADELGIQGDPDIDVYIPMTTMQNHFGDVSLTGSGGMSGERVELHEIIVQVEEIEAIPYVENVIEEILKQNHPARDYQLIVPYQLLEQARQTTRIFSIVLGSIAAISLIVGGIGIMNITLATVMERTREIGIRRAVGAKKRHIVEQFLTETVLLSTFGGFLGIVLGIMMPALITHFAGMKTIITGWSLVLAFGISATIGLIFGIYPAYRAANLDPIEALRHE